MLDIKFIRDNKELVKENCKNRNVNIDIDLLLNLDNERRAGLKEVETLRALRNNKSKGKPTEEEIAKLRQVGEEISGLEKKMEDIENKYRELLYKVPNLTHPETPMGVSG